MHARSNVFIRLTASNLLPPLGIVNTLWARPIRIATREARPGIDGRGEPGNVLDTGFVIEPSTLLPASPLERPIPPSHRASARVRDVLCAPTNTWPHCGSALLQLDTLPSFAPAAATWALGDDGAQRRRCAPHPVPQACETFRRAWKEGKLVRAKTVDPRCGQQLPDDLETSRRECHRTYVAAIPSLLLSAVLTSLLASGCFPSLAHHICLCGGRDQHGDHLLDGAGQEIQPCHHRRRLPRVIPWDGQRAVEPHYACPSVCIGFSTTTHTSQVLDNHLEWFDDGGDFRKFCSLFWAPFAYLRIMTFEPCCAQATGLASVPFGWVGEPQSLLINGRGRFVNCSAMACGACNATQPECATPVFAVVPGKTYRFRIASVTSLSALNFEIEVSPFIFASLSFSIARFTCFSASFSFFIIFQFVNSCKSRCQDLKQTP